MSDDLPLNQHTDREIIEALRSESRGLKKARAAIDEAFKGLSDADDREAAKKT